MQRDFDGHAQQCDVPKEVGDFVGSCTGVFCCFTVGYPDAAES